MTKKDKKIETLDEKDQCACGRNSSCECDQDKQKEKST